MVTRVVTDKLQDHLSYPPRGFRLPRAAAYLGMSETSFQALVREGRMPKPKKIKGLVIWDRLELDAAFEALQGDDAPKRNTMHVILGIEDK